MSPVRTPSIPKKHQLQEPCVPTGYETTNIHSTLHTPEAVPFSGIVSGVWQGDPDIKLLEGQPVDGSPTPTPGLSADGSATYGQRAAYCMITYIM